MFNYPGSPDPRVWAMKKDLDKAFGSIRAVEAKLDYLAHSTLTLIAHLKPNGGTGDAQQLSIAGFAKGTLPACTATKAGHECKSWNTKADGTGKGFPVGSKIDWTAFDSGDEMNLFAVWTPCAYQIEYELDGGVNGEGNPSSYVYGVGVPTLAPATKAGRTFVSWGVPSDPDPHVYVPGETMTPVESIPATQVGNVKLYALFNAAS